MSASPLVGAVKLTVGRPVSVEAGSGFPTMTVEAVEMLPALAWMMKALRPRPGRERRRPAEMLPPPAGTS